MRYKMGFESPTMTCHWMERNPGFIPIIDNDFCCVALCDNENIARQICTLLNEADRQDKAFRYANRMRI